MKMTNCSEEEKYFYTLEKLVDVLCPLNPSNDIDLRKRHGVKRVSIQAVILREYFEKAMKESDKDVKTMYEKLRNCKQFIKEYKRAIKRVYSELKREKEVLTSLVHHKPLDNHLQ